MVKCWPLTAALMGLQTLVLIGLAGDLIVVGATGGSDSGARAITEGITVLVLAACGGLLAYGFARRRSIARTPTLVWNLLAALVGVSLWSGGAHAVGAITVAVAVVTFVSSLGVPRYDLDDLDEDDTSQQ